MNFVTTGHGAIVEQRTDPIYSIFQNERLDFDSK